MSRVGAIVGTWCSSAVAVLALGHCAAGSSTPVTSLDLEGGAPEGGMRLDAPAERDAAAPQEGAVADDGAAADVEDGSVSPTSDAAPDGVRDAAPDSTDAALEASTCDGGACASLDHIGVFRPSDRSWTLDNGNGTFDGCSADECTVPFGEPGDLPVVGDWTGTGKSRIGVFRPSNRAWYLDQNGNGVFDGCGIDTCNFSFPGLQGDVPLVGDWTGSGRSKQGVFRPSDRSWTLDNNGNGMFDGCAIDVCYAEFGLVGDLPVVGDWSGSGTSRIGVFRPSDRSWTLDTNGNGSFDGCGVDTCLATFGAQGDLPIVGDFGAGGQSRIGVFRPNDRSWTLDSNGNGTFDGCSIDTCYGLFGAQGDLPVVGHWR
jgi:hypothetical protein